MIRNEETTPDFLDGLGDMLPAEIKKKVNEQIKKIQESGHSNHGSPVFNIYASGSQHVDHVENQYFYGSTCPKPHKEVDRESPLLQKLFTEEAKVLWEKVQAKGWVDQNYQPLISRTLAALLANVMAAMLGIKEKWKVFEALWKRKNMYKDYYMALGQKQSMAFQDNLKLAFA